ncbi:hypothetical protein CDD82_552 [Ophiocordyceps australis]|uniref:Uncharacterized protein n=1 Tax=Ophiocordyceps australis TaxID=1399860 RepID=A0A2C5ZHU1_9HYPO|nr:hypothetical protein CDD82_552 [Ophiocordyceps australis]
MFRMSLASQGAEDQEGNQERIASPKATGATGHWGHAVLLKRLPRDNGCIRHGTGKLEMRNRFDRGPMRCDVIRPTRMRTQSGIPTRRHTDYTDLTWVPHVRVDKKNQNKSQRQPLALVLALFLVSPLSTRSVAFVQLGHDWAKPTEG